MTEHFLKERQNRDSLPLTGVRVLEFGHVAAGPFTGMLLADLGADVVKIEPPTGDQLRSWPPIHREAEDDQWFSHNFASLNRNKRSVALNLKKENDLATVKQLVKQADVLIENYRPGVMAKLGLGFEECSKDHPGLVYCSISGFGLKGEDSTKGAYDVVVQAVSGLMSVTGTNESGPVKCGVPVGDFVAGLYAAFSVVSYLRDNAGEGRSVHLDCPMTDCLLGISALQTSEYWGTGKTPGLWGTAHPRNAPYAAFQASDKQFVIAAGNNQLWKKVTEVVERPDLFEVDEYATQELRASNQAQLNTALAPIFLTKTSEQWLQLFEKNGVPCGPLNTFEDKLTSLAESKDSLLIDVEVPIIGQVPMIAYPVTDQHGHQPARLSPPLKGEHNQDVCNEWITETV